MPSYECSKFNSRVRSRALTLLTQRYNDDYKKIYTNIRYNLTNRSTAQSKAKTILASMYKAEFKTIYLEVKQEMSQ